MLITYKPGIIIDSGNDSTYRGAYRLGSSETPQSFISKTQLNLRIIESKPIGKDLISLIVKRNMGIGTSKNNNGNGKQVTITNGWGTLTEGHYNTTASSTSMNKFLVSKEVSAGYRMMMPGAGADVLVNYSVELNYTSILKLNTPSFIALAHELIHALHWMSGNYDSSPGINIDKLSGLPKASIKEEALTVGAGTYENTRISENAIRREHRLPIREYYRHPADCFIRTRDRR